MAVSFGTGISLFKLFRDSWKYIDVTSYTSGVEDCHAAEHLKQKANEVLDFATTKLKVLNVYLFLILITEMRYVVPC